MKYFKITCLIFFLIIEIDFAQSLSSKKIHPLSGTFGVTFETGGTFSKTDYKIGELDLTGRLLFEYYFTSKSFNAFGIRLLGGGGFISGEVFSDDITYPPVPNNFKTEYYYLGGGFVYAMRMDNVVPYLSVSATYTAFNPLDENGYQLPNNASSIYQKKAVLHSGEAGIRFPFAEIWSINLGLNVNFANTDYLDDIKAGYNNDAFVNVFAGISFYLGKSIDQDNDGVEDQFDLCPNTPEGAKVDEFGCSEIDLKPSNRAYDTSSDNFLSNGIFSDGNLFCFQVDKFRGITSAKELQAKINAFGYKADIFEMNIGNLIWHSVRIGYFDSFDKAKFYKEDFFKKTKIIVR